MCDPAIEVRRTRKLKNVPFFLGCRKRGESWTTWTLHASAKVKNVGERLDHLYSDGIE
jgi:exonuclease III